MLSRAVVLAGLLLAACSSPAHEPSIVVHRPDALAPASEIAVTDLVADLAKITGTPVTESSDPQVSCVDGDLHVVVLGHEHDATFTAATTPLTAQQYTIDETRCGIDGHLVVIRGGSLLAAQWGVYDFLETLGVRYFHPEETLYPSELAWPDAPIAISTTPAIAQRSLHLHTTHPVELSPPLDAATHDSAILQRHWVDWNVKIRHDALDGVDSAIIGSYAFDRGFARETGINLVETQQGGRPVIDPNDPRPESVQMAEAIDAAMAPVEGLPPIQRFHFGFNPSEFTTADEQTTVDRITFVTTYLQEHYPGVEVITVNHGTAEPNGPVFGVRFFDLSQFAPPGLGVEVHPLMFYDLDRPAPVYGNADFHMLRDWTIDQQAVRRITYFPESSWWLTFDLPVPLFLAPVSLEARDHDLQLLAPYLASDDASASGVIGHKAFSSGQEWDYWLIDYCTARMTWDIRERWTDCLGHATAPFAQGGALKDLLVEVGTAQVDPLRDPGVLAMLVGSDDGTETAAQAGIIFHPLPPAPIAVLGWDDARVAQLRTDSLAKLPALAQQYADWAARADAIAAAQDDTHAPWVREVADGLRITGLRAAHANALYEDVLAVRAAIAAHDFTAVAAASAQVDAVRAITEQARAIVAAREAAYRYALDLSTAGDEVGTPGAVPNATIYPYRYLSRTHRLFYWTRPDEQLAALFGFDVVSPSARMIIDAEPLDVAVTASGVSDVQLVWGDGATSTQLEAHVYASEGVYDWTLDALDDGGVIHHDDRVAVVARRLEFPKGSLKISAPMGGNLIEGLLPGFAVGLGTDSADFLALGQLDGASTEITNGSVQRRARSGQATAAADLALALPKLGVITVFGAVLAVDDGTGPTDRTLTITGELSTDEIIGLVVTAGGFDPQGARDIVASTLGYTSDTLPARVAFTSAAKGSE